ncbi:Aste57867_16043 [Aphanomyces stellatus]|uniref:Aste57867_16043 protein n=1 Tax=Aphanomyces stellatus TaxID=120398 RepID=A0A485L7R0_9STRA|nr:hypothetical protein As57867_015987 [Aphanomyces stellatus]VFT92827.1 Aste57867_16043 [Aphanomyces stellatus]
MLYREAAALVEDAAAYESRGEYERAAETFILAASGLESATDSEPDPKIQQLLRIKAREVESWGVNLYAWLEQGQPGTVPVRRAGSVLVVAETH